MSTSAMATPTATGEGILVREEKSGRGEGGREEEGGILERKSKRKRKTTTTTRRMQRLALVFVLLDHFDFGMPSATARPSLQCSSTVVQ
jgi:hypothetical protein